MRLNTAVLRLISPHYGITQEFTADTVRCGIDVYGYSENIAVTAPARVKRSPMGKNGLPDHNQVFHMSTGHCVWATPSNTYKLHTITFVQDATTPCGWSKGTLDKKLAIQRVYNRAGRHGDI